MANIDVLNLGGTKVGEFELADAVFAGRGQRGPAVGGGEALPRRAAPGNGRDQEPQARLRRRQEAVEAEGNRPRPRGFDPHSSVAWRRYGPRTAAPLLRLRVSAEEADGRPSRRPSRRRSTTASSPWSIRSRSRGQDQALPSGAEQARGGQDARCWSRPARSWTRS